MARKIYNFVWTFPPGGIDYKGPTLLQGKGLVVALTESSRAVILFPSLLTPLIYVDGKDDQWLELLVVSAAELTPDMVNRQLRISQGLEPLKHHSKAPLFGGTHDCIVVDSDGELDSTKERTISTHSRFVGVVHLRIAQKLVARGMRRVYRIKVNVSALSSKVTFDKHGRDYAYRAPRRMDYRLQDGDQAVTEVKGAGLVGLEDGDELIREILTKLQPSSPIAGEGLYALRESGSALDLMSADPDDPIQSYHPVFVFDGEDGFRYANLGHVSDIHINSRLDLLCKTPARVLEYGPGEHEKESPPIGEILMDTTRSFHSVLHEVMNTDCHALVVGGDLIDHIRNAYSKELARHNAVPLSAGDIWHAVDLEKNYTDASHPPGLDMIAFYSLIIRAIRTHSKPVLALSGNHDCYLEAFGISPRLLYSRTNEGIPADLNLTFYEALLAFGPSSGRLIDTNNFKPEWLLWFYAVFTPFQDYSLKLPNQTLVCMAWGEDEDILDVPLVYDQGIGHLPRSDDGVTDIQYDVVQKAILDRARKVILCTHYTFVSYNDPVPMYSEEVRTPAYIVPDTYSRFEMGCFERHRVEMFKHLNENKIQLVLTGHSHRRGVYLMDRDPKHIATMSVRMYDPAPTNGLDLVKPPSGARSEPAIVVSDSAGPYPRHNRSGEFGGWGSSPPAGTVVRFNSESGAIANVRAIQGVRNRPRAAVGLDYMDVSRNEVFTGKGIRSSPVPTSVHNRGASSMIYKIHVPLHPRLRVDMKASVKRVAFAGRRQGGAWIRVEGTQQRVNEEFWEIAADDNTMFRDFVNVTTEAERFVVIYMRSKDADLRKRFDWSQPWIFEVRVIPVLIIGFDTEIEFRFSRPIRKMEMHTVNWNFADVPNWKWRASRYLKYKRTLASTSSRA